MSVIFLGPRLWDPENAPDRPDDDPATCLNGCGLPYEDRDGAPCPCHEPTGLAA